MFTQQALIIWETLNTLIHSTLPSPHASSSLHSSDGNDSFRREGSNNNNIPAAPSCPYQTNFEVIFIFCLEKS